MYCSNSRGMATLLQQKNCMKTLTNGGVSGGGSNSSGSSTTATASIQQTRMLLPHEMVGIPSSIPISNINTATSFTGSTTNCYSQQIYDQTQNQPNQNQQLQQFNTHNQVNNVHQFSRYFPQFNNHDSNTSYMSTNSAINLNTSSHNFLSNAVTNMNTSSSGNTASQNANYHQSSVIIHKQNTVLNQHPPTTSSDTSVAQYIKEEIPENFGNDSANGCQNRNEQKFVSNNETLPNGALGGEEDQEPEPEIDIVINNVVCSFSVRCHLNLREIALNGFNVEFRRENGMVTMKLRRPYTTASIWSSGRITCTGATSEEQAKIAARRYARCLQKLGFSVRFHNFRVVNVLGTCSMPWAIKIVNFSERYKKDASYEPELHPGVTYKLKYPKATLKIFSTGSITVTAGSVAHVQAAIEHIYPLVYEFRKKRTAEELELLRSKQHTTEEDEDEEITHSPSAAKKRKPLGLAENDPREDIMNVSDFEGDEPEAV